MSEPLLSVEDLRVSFHTDDGVVHAVDGISYSVEAGTTLGIVGESGSGKSVSSLTTLGLTRARNSRIEGRIMFEGEDLVAMDDDQLRRLRGNDIAMIFQDPLSSLHPFYKVGAQLIEAVQTHRKVSKAAARDRAIDLLELVGIPDPQRRVDAFPHEFSGGMRQRAMIAMAFANEPRLLIADEPTTALDVTVQAQILALLEDLQKRLGMAIILITHDLGVVAEIADRDRRHVRRADRRARAPRTSSSPRRSIPYTWGLLKSIPRLDSPRDEELVPISGRPPSLINRPERVPFPSPLPVRSARSTAASIRDWNRCPASSTTTSRACSSPEVRARIWQGVSAGLAPESIARVTEPAPVSEAPTERAMAQEAED